MLEALILKIVDKLADPLAKQYLLVTKMTERLETRESSYANRKFSYCCQPRPRDANCSENLYCNASCS